MKRFPEGVTLEAQGGNLLLELLGKDAMTPGGLVLPGGHKDMHREGIVVSIGPTVAYQDQQVECPEDRRLKVGDRVLIGHAGDEMQLNGVIHVLGNRGTVLARLHGCQDPKQAAHEMVHEEGTDIERENIPEVSTSSTVLLPGVNEDDASWASGQRQGMHD